jgi:hypothetical protein
VLRGNRLKGKFLGSSHYRSHHLPHLPPGPKLIGGGFWGFFWKKMAVSNSLLFTYSNKIFPDYRIISEEFPTILLIFIELKN